MGVWDITASGFRPLHPLSLERIGEACAFEKWPYFVSRLVFLSRLLFKLILDFMGVSMLRTAKASNNVRKNNVKFISPAACDFNVVSFESLQNTVCNFRHLGFTWLYSIFILTTNKMELKCPLCTPWIDTITQRSTY